MTREYAPISLKEMDAVALLNRTDTKFVLSTDQLLQALAALQHDYRILSVAGQRLNHYRTLYFDTPNFDLYNLHVNERSDRYKVRSREYTDSRRSFLEVKHKTNKGRTIKERISTQPAGSPNDAGSGKLAARRLSLRQPGAGAENLEYLRAHHPGEHAMLRAGDPGR